MGDINVYSGPMKCGKTQQILNEYKRQLIAGKKVKMFKPTIDTRAGRDVVASRNGIDIPATSIYKISDLEKYDADVYCIDEFQFLKGNVKTIEEMASEGKKFFIAGLKEDDFASLTEQQIEKYKDKYSHEMILSVPKQPEAQKKPMKKEKHEYER